MEILLFRSNEKIKVHLFVDEEMNYFPFSLNVLNFITAPPLLHLWHNFLKILYTFYTVYVSIKRIKTLALPSPYFKKEILLRKEGSYRQLSADRHIKICMILNKINQKTARIVGNNHGKQINPLSRVKLQMDKNWTLVAFATQLRFNIIPQTFYDNEWWKAVT